MGACASTSKGAEAAESRKVSANGEAAPGNFTTPKTPESEATPAYAPASIQHVDAAAQRSFSNGSAQVKFTSAHDADVGAGPVTADGDASRDAAPSANDSRERAPEPPPARAAGDPQPQDPASAPAAAANGGHSGSEHAGVQSTAAADDPQAVAVVAVLAGGAYSSNTSGPPRPACQQDRLATVNDIRDTLKRAHDPAIGTAAPRASLAYFRQLCS